MSFIETIKEATGSVVEVIKENPVAVGISAAVVAVGVGGTIWYRRRKAKKVDVKAVIGQAEQVAAAGNPALAAAHAATEQKATA